MTPLFKNYKTMEVEAIDIPRKAMCKIRKHLSKHGFQLIYSHKQSLSYWNQKWCTFKVKPLSENYAKLKGKS
jgi:hypothetical protein